MIRARRIVKRFGDVEALSGIDIQIQPGECLVLTGAPKAGRTTLLRILATLMRPTSGAVEIDGVDAFTQRQAARRRVMYADGWLAAADGLSTAEYLTFVLMSRAPRPVPAPVIRAATERAQLAASVPVERLSTDERARLALACALAAAADVVLLDEPLRHMSDALRPIFTQWIEERRAAGAAIVAACSVQYDGVIATRTLGLDRGRLTHAPLSGAAS